MEKRLNKKIELYITEFKDSIRIKLLNSGFENKSKLNELIEFIYEYDRLTLNKEDFVKRKRVKNSIPSTNRCNARRANGEQCTRRRKADCEFCGTHFKGTPHGLMISNNVQEIQTQKVDVFAEEINGIVYYIDNYFNVYKTQDILMNKENPEIISNYEKVDGKYVIPEFGLV